MSMYCRRDFDYMRKSIPLSLVYTGLVLPTPVQEHLPTLCYTGYVEPKYCGYSLQRLHGLVLLQIGSQSSSTHISNIIVAKTVKER